MLTGGVLMLVSTAITPIAPTMPILTAGLFLLGLGWNMGYIARLNLAFQHVTRDRTQPHAGRGRFDCRLIIRGWGAWARVPCLGSVAFGR
jgi:hypothetical protein